MIREQNLEKAYQKREKLEKDRKSVTDEIKLEALEKEFQKLEKKIDGYKLNLEERIPVIKENLDQIRNVFLNPEIKDDFEVNFGSLRKKQVFRFLKERKFNEERVKKSLKRLEKFILPTKRRTIEAYF